MYLSSNVTVMVVNVIGFKLSWIVKRPVVEYIHSPVDDLVPKTKARQK